MLRHPLKIREASQESEHSGQLATRPPWVGHAAQLLPQFLWCLLHLRNPRNPCMRVFIYLLHKAQLLWLCMNVVRSSWAKRFSISALCHMLCYFLIYNSGWFHTSAVIIYDIINNLQASALHRSLTHQSNSLLLCCCSVCLCNYSPGYSASSCAAASHFSPAYFTKCDCSSECASCYYNANMILWSWGSRTDQIQKRHMSL